MSTHSQHESSDSLPEIDLLWDYREPAKTEKKFRELLPIAASPGNEAYHAELLTQLARTYSLRRQFDTAHEILDTVENMLTEEMNLAAVRYRLERGRTYNSSGKKTEAVEYFHQAYQLAVEHGFDFFAVDAAHMLGIATLPEKQLEWNLKAVEMAEQSSDKKARNWLGPLYNNIGWTYHDMQQYKVALDFFKRALSWRQERNDEQGIIIAQYCVGRALRSLNRIDEAIQIHTALLEEIQEKNLPPDGYIHEELGECLLLKNKKEAATHHFSKAYTILSQDEWLQKNEPERLQRLKELSGK